MFSLGQYGAQQPGDCIHVPVLGWQRFIKMGISSKCVISVPIW